MEQVIKTPNEVFTFAAKCVTESKLGFDMVECYSCKLGSYYCTTAPSDVNNPCGTSACIAGDMAYNIDPKSKLHAVNIVQAWALGGAEYGNLEVGKGFHYARGVFKEVFNNPRVYGVSRLREVTKDLAITRLRELSKFDDWESVAVHLHNITKQNNCS